MCVGLHDMPAVGGAACSPVNYYSPGGQQGFAQCLPCPGVFTTAGAVAAANCLCELCCQACFYCAVLSNHALLLVTHSCQQWLTGRVVEGLAQSHSVALLQW